MGSELIFFSLICFIHYPRIQAPVSFSSSYPDEVPPFHLLRSVCCCLLFVVPTKQCLLPFHVAGETPRATNFLKKTFGGYVCCCAEDDAGSIASGMTYLEVFIFRRIQNISQDGCSSSSTVITMILTIVLLDPEALHHLVQNGVDAARVVFLDCDNNNHECNMVQGIRVDDYYGRSGATSGWLMQDKLGGGQSYYPHHPAADTSSSSSSGHTSTLLMMEMDDTE